MKAIFRVIVCFVCLSASNAFATVLVKQVRTRDRVIVISLTEIKRSIHGPFQFVRSLPFTIDEGPQTSSALYQEILYRSRNDVPLYARQPSLINPAPKTRFKDTEVRALVTQGPTSNRINLAILGDGYTLQEKELFFTDAQRITNDLFQEQTFSSYIRLFNVFAVFVPSNESGISDLEKKDTVFGLYRYPRGSKRAIMPGNSGVIEDAIALAPASDYPILIANDNFYGGLGGRYAITTRSLVSGPIVLRHELGHNFGNVGEEYDGGSVYAGANYSSTEDVGWKQWVTGDLQAFDAVYLGGEYVWQNLKDGPFRFNFRFPAPSKRGPYGFYAALSSVGWETAEDVSATLDNTRLEIRGTFTADRSFFDIIAPFEIPAGNHTVVIQEQVHDNDNVLAFGNFYAYPPDYDFTPDRVAAFPTFDESGQKVGYRPTHNSCIMREMRLKYFCAVDKENMWRRFMSSISLIDAVQVSPDTPRRVTLQTQQLEPVQIGWFEIGKDGTEHELTHLRNQRSWEADASQHGQFRVRVGFATSEVRAVPGFESSKEFAL